MRSCVSRTLAVRGLTREWVCLRLQPADVVHTAAYEPLVLPVVRGSMTTLLTWTWKPLHAALTRLRKLVTETGVGRKTNALVALHSLERDRIVLPVQVCEVIRCRGRARRRPAARVCSRPRVRGRLTHGSHAGSRERRIGWRQHRVGETPGSVGPVVWMRCQV